MYEKQKHPIMQRNTSLHCSANCAIAPQQPN